ncbi:hypothetical protein ACQY0O_004260 [Thecaphora frezii]
MQRPLTPAPSSDALTPSPSPVKQQQKSQQQALEAMLQLSRVAGSMPLTRVDLNVIAERANAFQAARQKAGATPPPSSPTAASHGARPNAAVSCSASSPELVAGASPCKSRRVGRRSDASDVRLSRGCFYPETRAQRSEAVAAELAQPDVGLEPNADASQAANVPHVLWACSTHSLVLGRCKPSGMPHASWRQELDARAAPSQDVQLLQSIAPSTQGLGARRIIRVNLPNEARHVSRVHAIIEWIPFVPSSSSGPALTRPQGTFIVRIIGQNGLIVDGKRRREGQVLRLTPGKTVLDFFGVKALFQARQIATPGASTDASSIGASPADGHSPVKRLSFAQLRVSRTSDSSHFGLLSRDDLPSSPPPTSELHFTASSSPSKSSIGESSPTKLTSRQPASSKPKAALGGLLTAGAHAQRRIMVGASDDEGEEDEEDDEDDDDYVPESAPAFGTQAGSAATPNGEPLGVESDASSVASTLQAASTSSQSVRESRSTDVEASRQSSKRAAQPKVAQVSQLTESQTRMPPPAVALRTVSRRSASNSPAPASPLIGGFSSVQKWQSLARRCVRLLAPTYDLPGLLAGAIVFHRTATISASEAVRSVLAGTPGLMKGEAGERSVAFSPSRRQLPGASTLQHGCVVEGWPSASETNDKWTSIARKAWREHLEVVLQSSPMFGVIHRAGKDASGNPLECWYYYDKDNDPDRERAENLGAFAKPMRKAIKGQKPIFWKKSGYRSRKDDFEIKASPPSRYASRAGEAEEEEEEEEESINMATAPLPTSAVASQRSGSKRRAQADESDTDEERKREALRAKIAKSGVWDETQPEEREEATWDKVGDRDWKWRSK